PFPDGLLHKRWMGRPACEARILLRARPADLGRSVELWRRERGTLDGRASAPVATRTRVPWMACCVCRSRWGQLGGRLLPDRLATVLRAGEDTRLHHGTLPGVLQRSPQDPLDGPWWAAPPRDHPAALQLERGKPVAHRPLCGPRPRRPLR